MKVLSLQTIVRTWVSRLCFMGFDYWWLYLFIWDFLLSQINLWTTTTWSTVWVILPKPSSYEFLIGFLIWTSASKYLHLTTFSNILCDFIHVLIFVNVSKCRKSPKWTNIVILDSANDAHIWAHRNVWLWTTRLAIWPLTCNPSWILTFFDSKDEHASPNIDTIYIVGDRGQEWIAILS